MGHWLIVLGFGLALTAFVLVRIRSQRPQGFWYYATLSALSVFVVILAPITIDVGLSVLRRLVYPTNYYYGYPQAPRDVQAYLIGLGAVLAVWLWLRVRSANLSRIWKLAALVGVLALPMIVPLVGEAIFTPLSTSTPLSFLHCRSLFYSGPHNAWSWAYFYSFWCDMALVGKLNAVLLLSMMGYTFHLMLSRTLGNREARNQSRAFAREVSEPVKNWDLGHAISVAERYPKSPVAKAVASGLVSFQEACPLFSIQESLEFAKRSFTRSASTILVESRRSLSPLSVVLISAPMIGVFGTHVHMVHAPFGAGPPRLSYVNHALGQALLPVLLSLLIAVLAWWFRQHLSSEIDTLEGEMEAGKIELLNHLSRFPKKSPLAGVAIETT